MTGALARAEADRDRARECALAAVRTLATESGMPAHNALGAPLVRCACGVIHYAVPGGRNRTGALCVACVPAPPECQCFRHDCGSCGPRRSFGWRPAVRLGDSW